MDWEQLRRNAGDFVHGLAYGSYEKHLRDQAAELNELFLLLCYLEAMGVPNPATFYLLEVYPYLLDEFHRWHRRLGIPNSPLANLPCC